MKRLKSIGAFWYDFVVGDDWRVAAVVVVGSRADRAARARGRRQRLVAGAGVRVRGARLVTAPRHRRDKVLARLLIRGA